MYHNAASSVVNAKKKKSARPEHMYAETSPNTEATNTMSTNVPRSTQQVSASSEESGQEATYRPTKMVNTTAKCQDPKHTRR